MTDVNKYRYMLYLDNPQFLPENADFILKKSREITNSIKITIRD
jgi:hypothetical protein